MHFVYLQEKYTHKRHLSSRKRIFFEISSGIRHPGHLRVEREGKPSLVTEKSVIGTCAPMTRIRSLVPERGLFSFRAR